MSLCHPLAVAPVMIGLINLKVSDLIPWLRPAPSSQNKTMIHRVSARNVLHWLLATRQTDVRTSFIIMPATTPTPPIIPNRREMGEVP